MHYTVDMKFCDGRVLRQISATLRDGTFGSFRLCPLCDVLGCFSIRNPCSGWHNNGNGGCLSRFSVLFSSAFTMDAVYLRRFCADEIHNAPVVQVTSACRSAVVRTDYRTAMFGKIWLLENSQSVSQSVSKFIKWPKWCNHCKDH